MNMQDLDKLDLLSDDLDLDGIEDLPGFEAIPGGQYFLDFRMAYKKITTKKGAEMSGLELTMEVLEEPTLDDEKETAPPVGRIISNFFGLKSGDTEKEQFALKLMKQHIAPFAEVAQTSNVKELVKYLSEGAKAHATVTKRPTKDDPDLYRNRVKDIEPVT